MKKFRFEIFMLMLIFAFMLFFLQLTYEHLCCDGGIYYYSIIAMAILGFCIAVYLMCVSNDNSKKK